MQSGITSKRKIESVALDIQFLQKISETPAEIRKSGPQNISELQNFLRLRNSKYSYTKNIREEGQDWVKKKGGNLQPLIEKIKVIKESNEKKVENKKTQTDCYFYMRNISIENQQQYINKNFQYGIFSTIQHISSSQKQKGNLVKRCLEKKRNNYEEFKRPAFHCQSRKKQKKSSYIESTLSIVNSISNPTAKHFVECYEKTFKEKFWWIMRNHIGGLSNRKAENGMSSVMIRSLEMVEEEFNKILPHSYEGVLYYITNNYLNKLKGSYERHQAFGPIWAIAFFNYRAGRKEEFYRCLNVNEQLLSAFKEYDHSVKNYKPKPILGINEGEDVFQKQLIYCLKGISLYSDDALCDPNLLDIVWIFLRNVGIYGNMEKLNELRKQLFDSYCKYNLSETKLKNLLYLGGYGDIAELGQNQLMDQDDFLHFLLALSHSPQLMMGHEPAIRNKLSEQLIIYIHELIMEKRPQYLLYMLLMPEENVPRELSSIISSSQLLEEIKWEKFKERFSEKTFRELVKNTLRQYGVRNHNYVEVGKKYCELLNQNKLAIDFMLETMIKSVIYGKVEKSQLQKAQRLAIDIMKKDGEIEREYRGVFRIFHENQRLIEANIDRNSREIRKRLQECEHILVSEQLRFETAKAIQKLIEKNGFEVYIIYLKNAVKSYELVLINERKPKQLSQLHHVTLNSLNQLLKRQPYLNYAEKEYVMDILSVLESKVYIPE